MTGKLFVLDLHLLRCAGHGPLEWEQLPWPRQRPAVLPIGLLGGLDGEQRPVPPKRVPKSPVVHEGGAARSSVLGRRTTKGKRPVC